MKKMFRNLMLVAVAAMGLASCQNESIQEIARPQEVIMTIIAEADDTRTVINEANSRVNWSEGDQLKVIENSAVYRTTTAINIGADGKAQFTVAFPENAEATSFTYNAIYPASAVVEDDADKVDASKVKVIVNDTQMPTATSFDPKADILVSKHIETEAQPTELNMQFKRLVALGKMTLKNIPADAAIEKVIFTAGADDVVAGRNYVNATTGEVSQYGYHGKTNVLTISYDEPIATRDIYFACNPFEMEAGETFIVKVVCDDATYTREVTIPTGRSLTFVEGDLNTFTVDMTNATKESNFVFTEGDYAVLVVKNEKYYAMTNVDSGASTKRLSSKEVTYNGTPKYSTDDDSLIWTITNINGKYTFQDINGKYLSWTSDNSSVLVENSFELDINPVDGTKYYNISVASDPTRILAKNSSNPYFAFYGGTQDKNILLVPIGANTDPYFTVSPSEYEFSANGGEAKFEVNAVNGFNAVVTATTDADWLNISDDEDYIFCVESEMNKGAARSTTITFSAEGCNSVVVTINQEGDENPSTGDITPIASILALDKNSTINAVIEGVVVSNYELNNLTSKKGIYVQDETGALQLYLAANHEIAFGTKVQIDLTGRTLDSYNGAVQVSGLALDKITTISTGNTVTPKTVSIADFLANKYEGQYIALDGVQVAASDLSKTWVMNGAHTSINIEDTNGNKFVVFSSKYATYGTSTVAQGAGTIKGISSINNGNLQIIFAQNSDYAGLTGARFDAATPDPEPTPGTGDSATISFSDRANRTEFTTEKQVWQQNGITVTNNKSASTNDVADYCKPARFYANSNLIVEAPGNIKSIVFDCNSSSYATALKNSIGTTATTSVSSDKVTVTLDGTSDTFTISKFTAQVRMDSVTVTN